MKSTASKVSLTGSSSPHQAYSLFGPHTGDPRSVDASMHRHNRDMRGHAISRWMECGTKGDSTRHQNHSEHILTRYLRSSTGAPPLPRSTARGQTSGRGSSSFSPSNRQLHLRPPHKKSRCAPFEGLDKSSLGPSRHSVRAHPALRVDN